MEKQTFHANGKLLITGEYLVMRGALALAVPTVLGQEMVVNSGVREGVIQWKSMYGDECWFEGEFEPPEFRIINSSDKSKADFIVKLLREAAAMNPDHLSDEASYRVETKLGFNPEWGLGSSSSLTNLIGNWFMVDPWELFKKTQSGSGYDITCARVLNPIWFRLSMGVPISQKVDFNPSFKEKLAFVYSGRKQSSAGSVDAFNRGTKSGGIEKDRITAISRELPTVKTIQEFNTLLDEHEKIMSGILQLPRVKERFPGFPGSIKSLGAWGGDFILASSEVGFKEIKSYFSNKELNTIFSFDDIVLDARH